MLNTRVLQSRRKYAPSEGSGGGGGGGGGTTGTVQLKDQSWESTSDLGGAASISFNAAGTVTGNYDGTPAGYNWLLTGANTEFQIRATLMSGTNTGTFGTWQDLTANRSWSKFTATIGGYVSCIIKFEIRRKSDFTVLATCTVSLAYEDIPEEGGGGPIP